MENFTINEKFINLSQLLKALNIAESGGEAKDIIDAGEVTVNNYPENRYRKKLYPGDVVEVSGKKINIKEEWA